MMDSRKHPAQIYFLAFCLGGPILFAWPALGAPGYYDDLQNIIINRWVQSFEPTWQYFQAYFSENSFNRALAYFTFGFDVWFWGGSVKAIRVENLIFHGGTAFLLWKLMCQWRTIYRWNIGDGALMLGSMIWVVHPFMLDTPIYLVQRMAVLASGFGVAAWLCWNRFWMSREAHDDPKEMALGWVVAAAVLLVVAFLFKENAILIPFVWVLELWIVRKKIPQRAVVITMALALPALYGVGSLVVDNDLMHQMLKGYDNRPFTLEERLLTESRILWVYLGIFVFPHPNLLAFYLAPELSVGFFSPLSTAFAIVGHVLLFSLAVVLIRKGYRWFGFVIISYYALHSLESGFIPLQLAYEHRMYFPAAFLMAALWGPLVSKILPKLSPLLIWISLGVLFSTYAFAAGNRAYEWRDPLVFWGEQVKKTPHLANAFGDYAAALVQAGESEKANDVLLQAYKKHDADIAILANLLSYRLRRMNGVGFDGLWEKLLLQMEKPKFQPGTRAPLDNLVGALLDADKTDEAEILLRKLVRQGMGPTVISYLAQIQHKKGFHQKEEKTLKLGLSLYPYMGGSYIMYAKFLTHHGDRLNEAIDVLSRGIERVALLHEKEKLTASRDALIMRTQKAGGSE